MTGHHVKTQQHQDLEAEKKVNDKISKFPSPPHQSISSWKSCSLLDFGESGSWQCNFGVSMSAKGKTEMYMKDRNGFYTAWTFIADIKICITSNVSIHSSHTSAALWTTTKKRVMTGFDAHEEQGDTLTWNPLDEHPISWENGIPMIPGRHRKHLSYCVTSLFLSH